MVVLLSRFFLAGPFGYLLSLTLLVVRMYTIEGQAPLSV